MVKGKSKGLKLSRLFLGRGRSPSPTPLRGTTLPPLSPTGQAPAMLVASTLPSQAASHKKLPSPITNHEEEDLIPRKNKGVRSNTNPAAFTFEPQLTKQFSQRKSVSTVEDLLNCEICSRRFVDPKMLPCQHTFCMECLQEQVTFGTGRNNILLTCPVCSRQEKMNIRAPEQIQTAISKLPSNLYINSLLNMLQGSLEVAQLSPGQLIQAQPLAEAEEAQGRCCKCQTACDTKMCAHCKQVFCTVCWSSHMSELQGQLSDLEEQLSAAKEKLAHRTEDFEARCQDLEASIQAAAEAKRQALAAEEMRLKSEAKRYLEVAHLDAAQLMDRLDETAHKVEHHGAIILQASDENKVAMFLSLHKTTAELLDAVAHWGEVIPVLDLEMSKIGLQEETARDDDDPECDESDKLRPELINNEEDMALYYRTRSLVAHSLLGKSVVHRLGGVSLCPWGQPNLLYVAGNDNRQVMVFDLARARLQRRISAPNMIFPQGLAFCAKREEMYVTDKWGHSIHVFDKDGNFARTLCCRGHGGGQLRSPEGIAVGPDPDGPKDGTLLYVCDTNNDRLQVLRPEDGSMVRVIGIEEATTKDGKYRMTEFNQPSGVAVSGDMVVVTDFGNSKVKVFSTSGQKLLELGSPGSFKSPECVAIDRMGFILVGDSGNARVQVFSSSGHLVRIFGKRGSTPGKLQWVSGLHVSDNMNIFLTDFRNHSILVF